MKITKILSTIILSSMVQYGVNSQAQEKPLLSCLLNKSFTLELYKENDANENVVQIKIKHFLDEPTLNEYYTMSSKMTALEYGNVMMFLDDQGRSGYFFMRIEKGVKPSSHDIGNSTVTIDNNLFQHRNSQIFTDGHLKIISDCTWNVQ